MADNVTFGAGNAATAPDATVVATDEILGKHYQRIKVAHGVDGAAVDASATDPFPVTVSSSGLPSGAATEATLTTRLTESNFDTKVGSLTETVPTTDTASSGLNGRLQRIAQRITSFIALIPAALTGSGNFKISLQESNATQAATQSGTWTVQPGNTANTTAWKVDASSVAVPVTDNAGSLTVDGTVAATQSGTWNITNVSGTVSLPTGASTAAKQPALGTAGAASADVITVQGIASMTALKVDGSAVTQPVSIATAPVLVAGTAVIGKVGIDQTTPGTTNLVALAANQSVNVAQINGVTTTMGNGASGTGVQRVTIASDSTGVVGLNSGTNTIGKTYAALQTTKALTNANVSFSSSGENTVVSGTASQTIRVFAGSFSAASAVTLTIKDAASGNTLATVPLLSGGSFNFDTIHSGAPLFVTASSGAFIISLGSAVSVTGFVQYTKS